MIKKELKKAKRAAGKKAKNAAKKKVMGKRRSSKKERDAREVRQECSKMVKEEGKKGQLAPVKYLFEMANIFPTADDGSETSAKEESLAETLLHRLGIPTSPVVADEYKREANAVVPMGLGEDDNEGAAPGKATESEAGGEVAAGAAAGCE